MSGEHTHPELDMALGNLDQVVSNLMTRVEQLAGLVAERARGWRDYTGKATDPVPIAAGGWVDVPGCAVAGSPLTAPHEEHMLYVRLALAFSPDAGGGDGIVECRYVRSNGDPTGYDERHYAPGTDSIPFQMIHFELGERGVGGRWQLRLSGALTGATATTRYAKAHAIAVDWL